MKYIILSCTKSRAKLRFHIKIQVRLLPISIKLNSLSTKTKTEPIGVNEILNNKIINEVKINIIIYFNLYLLLTNLLHIYVSAWNVKMKLLYRALNDW